MSSDCNRLWQWNGLTTVSHSDRIIEYHRAYHPDYTESAEFLRYGEETRREMKIYAFSLG